MKLVSEQKAFYEYGKARGILKEVRFQMISMEYDEKRYHKLSKAICDAWQKRAACRAWVPLKERNCENCMHLHRGMKSDSPCFYCPGIDDEIPSNWVPRKEENE